MGQVNGDFDGVLNACQEEEGRVHEWEAGLPNADDITPLNHGLIPPKLLLAFNIKLDPSRTDGDVIRASEDTMSTIRGQSSGSNFKPFDGAYDDIDEEDGEAEADDDGDLSDSKKPRRNESPEDADSAAAEKTLKRPRLVWTPQLHKRFVDAVTHLGIRNAVPKTIMQLMNVEGLTRENVASHLQKYRLYLKRMQGVNFDVAPSNSSAASTEKLFVSPPVLGNSQENGGGNGNRNMPVHISMPYGAPPMVSMPVPMMGIGHGHMSMGMAMTNCNGFESNHHHHHHNNQYDGMTQTGNMYDSVVSQHHQPPSHGAPSDKR